MSEYILIFCWLGLMLFVSQIVNTKSKEIVLNRQVYRTNIRYAWIVFLPVIFMVAFRGYVGDTGAYVQAYNEIPNSMENLIAYLPSVNKDKGFTVLSGIIKLIVGSRSELYFLVLAIIQAIALVKLYQKYSTKYLFSIFLFIASTDYVSWMYNGIRQFTAVSIILIATTWMLNKKYISAIVVILLSATIHGSALLMLPFVFIAQGKAWNKKTIFFIVCMLIVVMFVDRFTDILDILLSDTQYTNVVSDWENWNDDGTNVLRVLAYSLPTVFSLIGLPWIRKANDPVINFCVNMSIVSTGFYVLSMFTSGIFIGRLPIYFSLYNYILLPWEIDNIFDRKSATLIQAVAIGCYLLFYFYQMHWSWGII